MAVDPASIHALCQHLADRDQYTALYHWMVTHQASKKICQPYLDQVIQRLSKRNPNELLEQQLSENSKHSLTCPQTRRR